MISERIFDDIPPQMKYLNMVIPILMYFFNIYTSKPDICFINKSYMSDVYPLRLPIISRNILSQISDVIQSDVALYLQVH